MAGDLSNFDAEPSQEHPQFICTSFQKKLFETGGDCIGVWIDMACIERAFYE